MTIAEKIRDLVRGYGRSCVECKHIALEMAEWKDQQYDKIIKDRCNSSYESGLAEGQRKAEERFKEYLEKKKEQYYNQPRDIIDGWYQRNYKFEALCEIINELFKEEKK